MADDAFAEWCIVELLGHRRLAGYIREVQLAGAGFLRLDIPESGIDPARTQYISPGSVYALHPVGEATARAAAASWRPEPVHRWELRAAARPDSEQHRREYPEAYGPDENTDWTEEDQAASDYRLQEEADFVDRRRHAGLTEDGDDPRDLDRQARDPDDEKEGPF